MHQSLKISGGMFKSRGFTVFEGFDSMQDFIEGWWEV